MATETHKPYPEEWKELFFVKADLDASFACLEGYNHFFTDAARGLIRFYQLRFEDAWDHFDKAYEGAANAPETISNLLRKLQLNAFCFNNRLLQAPVDSDNASLPYLSIPELPESILQEFPELKLALDIRSNCEGRLLLHLAEYEAAARIFENLIQEAANPKADYLMMNFLGLAGAQYGLGLEDAARRNLENAGFTVQTGGNLLGRATAAATLYAWYQYLGEEAEATGWKLFLERVDCPPATQRLFLKRADLILERSTQQSSLLVL